MKNVVIYHAGTSHALVSIIREHVRARRARGEDTVVYRFATVEGYRAALPVVGARTHGNAYIGNVADDRYAMLEGGF